MAERWQRRKKAPGKPPDERDEQTPAYLNEPGTSDEIVLTGKINYADQSYPAWPEADSARQYVATPEEKMEIQHGVVTYMDAATSEKDAGDEIERSDSPGHRRPARKPPRYEL